MSYIHDALKRSEAERQKRQAEGRQQMDLADAMNSPIANTVRPRSLPNMAVLAVLLLGLAGAGYYVLPGAESSARHEAAEPLKVLRPAVPGAAPSLPVVAAVPITPEKAGGASIDAPYNSLPYYWEIDSLVRQRLGEMTVTIHVYADNPAQRFLFLNDREYRAGEATTTGVRVERIEPEGVVLSYNQHVFRLPRPR
ncbi:MAG: general secretion pathway protein GspB [Gammaproteobacteria bacterium]|nr:general secretion pathway protein GspB [Gammaproteobacteria bacterium]